MREFSVWMVPICNELGSLLYLQGKSRDEMCPDERDRAIAPRAVRIR